MIDRAFVLGQFLGITELIEKGLTTPAQFIDSAIRIKHEYEAAQANHEAPYVAQAKRIADTYNAIAKQEARPDFEQGDPIDKL